MGSADEVNIQASELNRTMKVCNGGYVAVLHGYICCMMMCCLSCMLVASLWSAADSWQHNKFPDHSLVHAGHQQVPQQVYWHEHR